MMSDVVFPDYVETFIEATNRYLGKFGVNLEEVSQNLQSQARLYRISIAGDDDPIELAIHRTSRSFEQLVGTYRARMNAVIDPELARHFRLRGKELHVNRFATLGALAISEKDASVACQCLIQPDTQETVAGILATAVVHARPSILKGLLFAFNQEQRPLTEQPSAWTDVDFAQLQREYPDLELEAEARTWMISCRPRGVLSLTPVDNDPYWGGGLLCQSFIRESTLGPGGSKVDVNEMNIMGYLADNTPMFGGWWRDDDILVFRQAIPNFLKGLPNVTHLLIAWARSRLAFAPELVELARSWEQQRKGR
jgi:hypothetical protein